MGEASYLLAPPHYAGYTITCRHPHQHEPALTGSCGRFAFPSCIRIPTQHGSSVQKQGLDIPDASKREVRSLSTIAAKIHTELHLHVLCELPDDVALGEILAYVVLRQAETGREDATAILNSTADLCASLPHDLSEMRRDGVIRIILRNFACPRSNGRRNAITAARAGSKILSVGTKSATGMLEDTAVGPLLRRIRESIVPCEG